MRKILQVALLAIGACAYNAKAQTTERTRPAEWNNLVYGGRFMDRFLPMRNNGQLTKNTWGDPPVVPRYTDNGIEDKKWSFWCASIKYVDGKYQMFTAAWPESSPRGHFTWPNSVVYHAVADKMDGPYKMVDTVGKGHNPEVYKLKDGRWVLYVINSYYISNSVNGPWVNKKFNFQARDRRIMDGMSNCTFAQREDGTYLMINRGGGTWFSQTGDSTYSQVSEKSAYPPIKGNFEDPVVWRDNVQYNLIVNDWLGRIAYYLRSKDGITWKTEAGEAYMPGVSVHEDGTVEGWHKYERMRVLQDEYGRAIQANFAVIDVEKNFDKPNDNHSSKNIDIPLTVGRLLTIMDKQPITASTKTIRVKVSAEKGFDPQKDMDISSLHFGGSEEVDFGRGSKVLKTEKSGKDLIITFDATGNGIPDDDYAGKLLGKTSTGKLLFGYARLPWIDFTPPILSARLPAITANDNGFSLSTEVQNFGQTASKPTSLKIAYTKDGHEVIVGTVKVPALKPFEKTSVGFTAGKIFDKGATYDLIVAVNPDDKTPSLLHGKVTPVK